MPGMEATHMPNKRLEVANKNPTAKVGLFLTNETKFLIMKNERRCELTVKLNSAALAINYPCKVVNQQTDLIRELLLYSSYFNCN